MLYYKNKVSKKKHYIRLMSIFIIILISSISPRTSTVTSKIVNIITTPFAQATTFVTENISALIDFSLGTKPNRDAVKKLTIENQELRKEINDLEFIIKQKSYLKEAYDFNKKINSIKANVIMLNNSNYFDEFIIDKGKNDGVKLGDIVVNSYIDESSNILGALVGKITRVDTNSSIVSSILNENFNISFMHLDSNYSGIINERTQGKLSGYLLEKTDVKINDSIYTSGISGNYPRGIYIGKISSVSESEDKLTQLIDIESPINFNKLYEVFVLDGENK